MACSRVLVKPVKRNGVKVKRIDKLNSNPYYNVEVLWWLP